MALESSFAAPTGDNYATAYHRVSEVLIEVPARRMRVAVATYRNRAAASSGRAPVAVRQFVWDQADFDGPVGVLVRTFVHDLQTALTQEAELAGAADAPEV